MSIKQHGLPDLPKKATERAIIHNPLLAISAIAVLVTMAISSPSPTYLGLDSLLRDDLAVSPRCPRIAVCMHLGYIGSMTLDLHS
ncbi:MAG: hypothetical protein ACOX1O_02520 [Eggerthellaceae bacterium]|jgi:hypothetical protein